MDERGLFQLALGLEDPWQVVRIEFNAAEQRLDLHLDFPRGAKFKCPKGESYARCRTRRSTRGGTSTSSST